MEAVESEDSMSRRKWITSGSFEEPGNEGRVGLRVSMESIGTTEHQVPNISARVEYRLRSGVNECTTGSVADADYMDVVVGEPRWIEPLEGGITELPSFLGQRLEAAVPPQATCSNRGLDIRLD